MRVLFVCDGGPEVGGGHVMRCLTLAGALAQAGANCAFLDGHATGPVLDRFAAPDVARVAGAADWQSDWVVLDSYRSTLDEETGWRAASKLAVIDDLGRPHAADLVIDPSFGRDPAVYAPVPALTGPRYALVRPEFAALRPAGRVDRPVRRALIAFGLNDLGGITATALEAILPIAGPAVLDVVVGGSAPSLPRLRELDAQGEIVLHIDVRDMAALSAKADLAVGAGGSSIWERATLGLPSIVLALAENQIAMTRALHEAGALLETDLQDLGGAWARVMSDDGLRQGLSRESLALCDGQGADRAAGALLDA